MKINSLKKLSFLCRLMQAEGNRVKAGLVCLEKLQDWLEGKGANKKYPRPKKFNDAVKAIKISIATHRDKNEMAQAYALMSLCRRGGIVL